MPKEKRWYCSECEVNDIVSYFKTKEELLKAHSVLENAPHLIATKMVDIPTPEEVKGGCYQMVYCSECMMYVYGLGCPKIDQDRLKAKLIKQGLWQE